LIDTHTHLDNPQLADDLDAVMARAFEAGVSHMLLPNVNDESLPRMQALQARYPEAVRLMLGLHPCDVPEDWEGVLDRYEALWEANPDAFVAVGEIGLDLYWDKSTLDRQIQALHRQLDWCIRFQKPFSMHVREAWAPTMDVLRQRACPELSGVLHCFTGSLEIAQELVAMGHHLGIGGVATFKTAKVVDVLAVVGLDHVVLETDSPYLAPTPYRGQRNESAYVRRVAEHLADHLGLTFQDVDRTTSDNARRIFRL
jgi:TatD DNase family protein